GSSGSGTAPSRARRRTRGSPPCALTPGWSRPTSSAFGSSLGRAPAHSPAALRPHEVATYSRFAGGVNARWQEKPAAVNRGCGAWQARAVSSWLRWSVPGGRGRTSGGRARTPGGRTGLLSGRGARPGDLLLGLLAVPLHHHPHFRRSARRGLEGEREVE